MAKKLYINSKLADINGKIKGTFNGSQWDNTDEPTYVEYGLANYESSTKSVVMHYREYGSTEDYAQIASTVPSTTSGKQGERFQLKANVIYECYFTYPYSDGRREQGWIMARTRMSTNPSSPTLITDLDNDALGPIGAGDAVNYYFKLVV